VPVPLHTSSFTSRVKYNFIGMQLWNDLTEKAHLAPSHPHSGQPTHTHTQASPSHPHSGQPTHTHTQASPLTPTAKTSADPFPLNGEYAWAPSKAQKLPYTSLLPTVCFPLSSDHLGLPWHHTRSDSRHQANRFHHITQMFPPRR
jgi:hypothetical protein